MLILITLFKVIPFLALRINFFAYHCNIKGSGHFHQSPEKSLKKASYVFQIVF